MTTIYKYEIKVQDTFVLQIPMYGHILKVARQGGSIYAWVKGDTQRENVPITLRIFGTGHPLPIEEENLTYLDTVIMEHFVWHIFIKDDTC